MAFEGFSVATTSPLQDYGTSQFENLAHSVVNFVRVILFRAEVTFYSLIFQTPIRNLASGFYVDHPRVSPQCFLGWACSVFSL